MLAAVLDSPLAVPAVDKPYDICDNCLRPLRPIYPCFDRRDAIPGIVRTRFGQEDLRGHLPVRSEIRDPERRPQPGKPRKPPRQERAHARALIPPNALRRNQRAESRRVPTAMMLLRSASRRDLGCCYRPCSEETARGRKKDAIAHRLRNPAAKGSPQT